MPNAVPWNIHWMLQRGKMSRNLEAEPMFSGDDVCEIAKISPIQAAIAPHATMASGTR